MCLWEDDGKWSGLFIFLYIQEKKSGNRKKNEPKYRHEFKARSALYNFVAFFLNCVSNESYFKI